ERSPAAGRHARADADAHQLWGRLRRTVLIRIGPTATTQTHSSVRPSEAETEQDATGYELSLGATGELRVCRCSGSWWRGDRPRGREGEQRTTNARCCGDTKPYHGRFSSNTT